MSQQHVGGGEENIDPLFLDDNNNNNVGIRNEDDGVLVDEDTRRYLNWREKSQRDHEDTEDFFFDYNWLVNEKKMLTRNGYFMGASNGWIRVFTLKGREYWIAQATCHHRAPDWKIHFSVKKSDVPQAFNILAEHFVNSGCKFGMKAILLEEHWPAHMRGREITVYLYRHYNLHKYRSIREYLGNGQFKEHCISDKKGEYSVWRFSEYISQNPFDLFLLKKEDEEDLALYRTWVSQAEQLLLKHNIEPNGCADGDMPLGIYSSLRNETFIPLASRKNTHDLDERFVYPPNDAGWNAAGNDEADFIRSKLYIGKPHALWKALLVTIVVLPIIVPTLYSLM